ncbi:alpha/beta fold hydrolase [Marinobacter sp. HN1S83]|uniref:alpha/beta fold hydrolase n=1 Tax=Marinobacter sp. HN1S83 TaxID=3382301 RepID=UPI00387AB43D
MQIRDMSVPLGEGVAFQVRRIRHQASAGPTLVFLHESLGNIALWRKFPERLARASGLDALIYERRGYGLSTDEVLPRPYTYQEDEGSVLLPRLLDVLELREVILIGHSDGGSIALIAAGALGDRVKGLITMAAHTWADHLTVSGIQEMQTRYREEGLREKLLRHHGERTDDIFNAWHTIWLDKGFQEYMDFSRWLDAIQCPSMIIQGEDDEYGVPEQVTAIVEGIGDSATPVFLPETGHSPHLEHPEEMVQLVCEFLAGLSAEKSTD